MSELMDEKPSQPAISMRPIILKRLFSLIGIVPLGIYVIVHLWNNNYAWQGAEVFNKHLIESRSWPFYTLMTILFLYLPIAFHSLYGLFVVSQGRKTMVTQLTTNRHLTMLKYTLQRLSGIGILLFLGAHIYKTKIETAQKGVLPDYHHMHEGLSENVAYMVYICGILGISYHLANGLWSACITWGLTVNARSQKVVQTISVLLFFVIAALGFSAMQGFLK